MDRATGPASRAGAQLFEDHWEGVPGRVLAHEHVEVAVAVEDVEAVAARGLALEPLVRSSLALRQEARVQLARQEDEAGVGLRRLRGEVLGQLRAPLDRDKAARLDAALHLLEE